MATENKTTQVFEATTEATVSLLKAIKRCADDAEKCNTQSVNQLAMATNNLASALESVRGKR